MAGRPPYRRRRSRHCEGRPAPRPTRRPKSTRCATATILNLPRSPVRRRRAEPGQPASPARRSGSAVDLGVRGGQCVDIGGAVERVVDGSGQLAPIVTARMAGMSAGAAHLRDDPPGCRRSPPRRAPAIGRRGSLSSERRLVSLMYPEEPLPWRACPTRPQHAAHQLSEDRHGHRQVRGRPRGAPRPVDVTGEQLGWQAAARQRRRAHDQASHAEHRGQDPATRLCL